MTTSRAFGGREARAAFTGTTRADGRTSPARSSTATSPVLLQEQRLRERHIGDLLRVHALVRCMDQGQWFLDPDEDDLSFWVGGREDGAERNGASLPQFDDRSAVGGV